MLFTQRAVIIFRFRYNCKYTYGKVAERLKYFGRVRVTVPGVQSYTTMNDTINIYEFYDRLDIDLNWLDKWEDLTLRITTQPYQWINFKELNKDTFSSLLLYSKGNHSLFLAMFEKFYADYHTIENKPFNGFSWYVPFKNPIDKLLGGFLCTSYFMSRYSNLFKEKKEDMYEELEPLLDNFVDSILNNHIFDSEDPPSKSKSLDNHIIPLTNVLKLALKEVDTFNSRVFVGIDLETRFNVYQHVFDHFVHTKPEKIKEIFEEANTRQSPYSVQQHFYIQKYRANFGNKITELSQGPLKNEFKLNNFLIHGLPPR